MDTVTIPYLNGRIVVFADLHWDSYARRGEDPIVAHIRNASIGYPNDEVVSGSTQFVDVYVWESQHGSE